MNHFPSCSQIILPCLLLLTANWLPAAPTDTLVVNGPALLQKWVAPEYPRVILKEKISTTIKVRMIIDTEGHVTTARALEGADPRFADLAVAAVKQWLFKPAIQDDKPIASCLDADVLFSPVTAKRKLQPGALPPLSEWPELAPRTKAERKFAPSFDYPEDLEARRLPGLVRFHCAVGTDGRPSAVRIIVASHADLVIPALAALKRWEFTPQMEGDLPIESEKEGELTFDSVMIKREEVLAANGISAPDGTPPAITPEPRAITDPVWPVGPLLQGEGGSATAEFTITPTGLVTNVHVREASQPEFGQALTAALETWAFSRPIDNNQAVAVTLIKREEFKPVPLNASEDDTEPLTRLVLAMRRGEINGAQGLDQKITPLYRVVPEYPGTLKNLDAPAGEALIEFIIDRTGRARFPRIVSASREEFGWAAATAVSQWVFAPLTRGGKPVDVKVRIPFGFAAPTS